MEKAGGGGGGGKGEGVRKRDGDREGGRGAVRFGEKREVRVKEKNGAHLIKHT